MITLRRVYLPSGDTLKPEAGIGHQTRYRQG